jgi:uncharacterized damage-inducible protein DinB
MRPDQAEFLRDFYSTSFKTEHPITRRVIEAIPEDKADYRPNDVVKSAIDLAWHIVLAEHRFMGGLINGAFQFDSTRPESVVSAGHRVVVRRDVSARPRTDLDAARSRAPHNTRLRGSFQSPAIVFLQIGLHHTVHHRGQLSMYLRPMGAKVPSIYGESYDATQECLPTQTQ